VWLVLVLGAALAIALPLGVKQFGMPEIKFGSRAPHKPESAVRKAAADAGPARESDPAPKRARKPAPQISSVAPEDRSTPPDASILFDLPALEPEDGEPDPVATEPPNRLEPASGATGASRSDGDVSSGASESSDTPMLCGEVRNTQGVPIEGARVYLTAPARMERTDRLGRFCLACPSGARTVRIEAAGRAPVTRTVQVGRKRLETRFTLDAAN
jgi:hypothetical protein